MFDVTQSAKEQIAKILQTKQKKFFRVLVNSGGCNGLMYEFSFTDEKNQDDQIYNDNILIDSISMPFVTNSQIDFSKSLMRREFIIQNPNAKKSCGCNRSFS